LDLRFSKKKKVFEFKTVSVLKNGEELTEMVLSLVFKTVFGIFLSPLVCHKSVKYKMSGNFQVRSQGIPDPMLRKSLLGG
jgi:hypothetical protein